MKRIKIIGLLLCIMLMVSVVVNGTVYAANSTEVELRGEASIEVVADIADVSGSVRYIGESKESAREGVKQLYSSIVEQLSGIEGLDISVNYCDCYSVDHYGCDDIYVGKVYYNVKNINIDDIKHILEICNNNKSVVDSVNLSVNKTSELYAEAISKAVDEACAKMSKLTTSGYTITEIQEGYSYISGDYYNIDDLDIDTITNNMVTINSSVTVKFVA